MRCLKIRIRRLKRAAKRKYQPLDPHRLMDYYSRLCQLARQRLRPKYSKQEPPTPHHAS